MRSEQSLSKIKFIYGYISDQLSMGSSVAQIKSAVQMLIDNDKATEEEANVVYDIFGIRHSNSIKGRATADKIRSVNKAISYIQNQFSLDDIRDGKRPEGIILGTLKSLLKAQYISNTIYKNLCKFYGLGEGENFNVEFCNWLLSKLELVGESILSRQELVTELLGEENPILRELTMAEVNKMYAKNPRVCSSTIRCIYDNYIQSLKFIFANGSKASKGIFEDLISIDKVYIVFALLCDVMVEVEVDEGRGARKIYSSYIVSSPNSHKLSTNFPDDIMLGAVRRMRVLYWERDRVSGQSSSPNDPSTEPETLINLFPVPIHRKVKSATELLKSYVLVAAEANRGAVPSDRKVVTIHNNILCDGMRELNSQPSLAALKDMRKTVLSDMQYALTTQYNFYREMKQKNELDLYLASSFICDAYIVTGVTYKVATKISNVDGSIRPVAKELVNESLHVFDRPDIQILYSIPNGLEGFKDIGKRVGFEVELTNNSKITLYKLEQKYESAIGSIAMVLRRK